MTINTYNGNRKKKVGKKYDVAAKNSLADKPASIEHNVSYDTCNINNGGIECKNCHTTEMNEQIVFNDIHYIVASHTCYDSFFSLQ